MKYILNIFYLIVLVFVLCNRYVVRFYRLEASFMEISFLAFKIQKKNSKFKTLRKTPYSQF